MRRSLPSLVALLLVGVVNVCRLTQCCLAPPVGAIVPADPRYTRLARAIVNLLRG